MTDVVAQQEDIQYIKEQVLAKFPLLGVAMLDLPVIADDRVKTAATDGHKIIYSPKFFSTLSEEEKQFVFAHEVMHVAFNHILRSQGRNQKLWDIATDSVINQILKNEKLPLPNKWVDIKEAINHSAEEMYEKLLKKKKEREQKKQQENQQAQSDSADQSQSDSRQNQSQDNQSQDSSKNGQGQDQNGERSSQSDSSNSKDSDWDVDWDSDDEQAGHDSHDLWKEAVSQAEREQQEQSEKKSLWDKLKEKITSKKPKENQESDTQKKEILAPKDENMDAYEKGFIANNEQKQREVAERVRANLNRIKENFHQQRNQISSGAVGETKTPVADWKKLLKKSINEEKDRWSYRRSDADNDYMARVEEIEEEDRAETEVMLDVSGSVNIKLLREFLRQLKPLLKSSKLKVACFDEYVYPFKEIKTNKDIDNFQITATSQWTENWDAAVRAFSNKKNVNKIVFTDGYPAPGIMPQEDLKGKNVIWLVYGNKDFQPCCGKVIQVSKKQIKQHFKTPSFLRDSR